MKGKTQNIFKYISLTSLLLGIAVWIWYIIYIIILGKMVQGEILITIPIGVLGVISGVKADNKKLIVLNLIQSLSLIITLFIAFFFEAIQSITR